MKKLPYIEDKSFNNFSDCLINRCFEFKEGFCFSSEEINEYYNLFIKWLRKHDHDIIVSMGFRNMIWEWCKIHFLTIRDINSSDYWLVEKDNGWYVADICKPEYNVSVLVLIPGEDNHVTSGMWDISNTWVLLDDDRVPDEKVSHWYKVPKLPDSITHPLPF